MSEQEQRAILTWVAKIVLMALALVVGLRVADSSNHIVAQGLGVIVMGLWIIIILWKAR